MNVITSITTTSANVREYLTVTRTYYVRTDGSDSNDGLTNTAAGAFLTIQHAVDVVCTTLDLNSQAVTIQVADGAYNAQVNLKDYVGTGPVVLRGNVSTPANVTISTGAGHAIFATFGYWSIQGLSLSTTGAGADGINADGTARVVFTAMNFGACGRYHAFATSGATVIGSGSYAISGGAFGHLGAGSMCRLGLANATVTLSGTPAFTGAFVVATYASAVEFYTTTFSGAATGKRYDATLNGVISTGGGGATYLPGNIAGTTSSGGQYA